MISNDNKTTGYYGKVPSHGDFISRGLPASFTDPWHLWITGMMATSRQQLGNEWMEYYLTAPLYRFALSSGVCGASSWIGVIIPSVDRVGRYYPMTLCKPFSNSAKPLDLLDTSRDWFQRAERILMTCLDDDFSMQAFDAAISTFAQPRDDDATRKKQPMSPRQYAENAWQYPLNEKANQSAIYPDLAHQLLHQSFATFSIWRTSGSDLIAPCMVVAEGLPMEASVAAMLDGRWEQWGWNSEHIRAL